MCSVLAEEPREGSSDMVFSSDHVMDPSSLRVCAEQRWPFLTQSGRNELFQQRPFQTLVSQDSPASYLPLQKSHHGPIKKGLSVAGP